MSAPAKPTPAQEATPAKAAPVPAPAAPVSTPAKAAPAPAPAAVTKPSAAVASPAAKQPAKVETKSEPPKDKVTVTNENHNPVLNINIGGSKSKKDGSQDAVVAVCPTVESKTTIKRTFRKKRETFKPLPVDALKKLISDDDFIVDYYFSYTVGTSQGLAEKARKAASASGFSTFMHSDVTGDEGPVIIALNLHRCKAFVIFITKEWLEAPECEFEYMIAQRLNMTSSRPVILPVMCEELKVKDYPIMSAILPNLPLIDLWKFPEPERGINYAIAVSEFLVSPSLLRPSEWRRQREALAFLTSELMMPVKQFSENQVLPSGDYMGFFSDERNLPTSLVKGGSRFLFQVSLKFDDDDDDNNNKDSKKKDVTSFSGFGEDELDIFQIGNGKIGKDGLVEFEKKYSNKLSYRMEFSGKVKNFVLAGSFAQEDTKKKVCGYWIMWPLRVYWKYRLESQTKQKK